jgi:hypothetical protein
MRVTVLSFLFLIIAACADSDGPERPGAEECRHLGEHVIDLRLTAADTSGRLSADDLAQHRAALQAAGAGFADQCRSQRTPREVACLLAANDLDSLTACTVSPDPED